jgi:hypothetical protein
MEIMRLVASELPKFVITIGGPVSKFWLNRFSGLEREGGN